MAKKPLNTSPSDISLPLVIVNPRSASGSTQDNWASNAAELRAHFGPFGVEFTKGPEDAIAIAESEARSGRKFIIACGGDGTINEVANGIIRSGCDVEMGVLPSGTGGDFRRTLGMPNSVREASVALRNGKTKVIDAGKIHFLDHHGKAAERFFVNVSSVGLSSSIIERVKSGNGFDWLPIPSVRGRANFAVSTLREVIDVKPLNIRVRIDGAPEKTLQTVNFCVANARYFGGGMLIAPEAKLTDGLFEVVNVGDMGAARIIAMAHTLYRGTHIHLHDVGSTVAKRIEVSAGDPNAEIHIEIDGELPGRLPAIFEIIPNALRIRVPKANPAGFCF